MTGTVGRRCASLIALGALMLGGCQSMPSWLPTYDAKVTARVDWQVPLGAKGGESFAPAVRPDAIYAASPDGTIVSVDPASGRQIWRIKAERPLSAGVGAQPGAR